MIFESAAFLPRLPMGGGRRRGVHVRPPRGLRSCLDPARPRSRRRPSLCPARVEVLQVFGERGLARFQDPSMLSIVPLFVSSVAQPSRVADVPRRLTPREHADRLCPLPVPRREKLGMEAGEGAVGGGASEAGRAQPDTAVGARAAGKGRARRWWRGQGRAGRWRQPRIGARNCTSERFFYLIPVVLRVDFSKPRGLFAKKHDERPKHNLLYY